MNLLVLWLLITPVFFALGWIAGRIDMKTVIKQTKTLPKRIFDSIDALIERNTGVAGDNLSSVISQEPQLTELTLSLGKLYRSRGENDIAINLHTKLLNSQYLFGADDKDKVRIELARDFHKAGLVDRAENILLKLSQSNLYANKAEALLLQIYQQDKNWLEAIETAKKLATSDYSYHTEVAQFNCELAQEAFIKSDAELATKYIKQALDTNRKCARANMILGEIYLSQEEYVQAISAWQLIEKQNYLYLPMVANRLFAAYLHLNKIKEGLRLIKGYATLYTNLNLEEVIYQKLIDYESVAAALEYLRANIKLRPNAKLAALLLDVHLNSFQADIVSNVKQDMATTKALLDDYHERLNRYKCGRCNFKGKTFFWQCPACYEWESINPNSSEL